MDLEARVRALFEHHPAVRDVQLVGSRAHGDPAPLSDWDFLVASDDVDALAEALPDLAAALEPLVGQWDRLSEESACYMLLLADGTKVDFVVERAPRVEPPWEVRPETLAAIDGHFWDWILWLGGKQLHGREELVASMLGGLMFEHLLRPLGVSRPPQSIREAVAAYRETRGRREREFGIQVPRHLEEAVLPRLQSAGLS